jgi:EAL domain-containing protein (putative c-di-GMP-specific phosphodiesterase class I)
MHSRPAARRHRACPRQADGGQRLRFFEESMDKALQRRRMVEQALRLARGREDFEVVYQSQYILATGAQVGLEALVRLHHPVHGKVAPAHYISAAEEIGLARFAFHKIKIDRQFVRNMMRDPAMRAIVNTIIALGKSLDVTVTAEGVESEEQAAMLREFGCPQVQDVLSGQPGSPDAASNGRAKVTPIKPRSSAAPVAVTAGS